MTWSRQRLTPNQPNVLLLDASAAVPVGTPNGTVIFRKTAEGTLSRSVPVLLLENGASVPAGTPINTVVLEKA